MSALRRLAPGLLLVLCARALGAQAPATPDTIAFAGGTGIYVWLGGTVVSRAHPVRGVVAHRVERRRPGATRWERVAEVQGPATADAFFGHLAPVLRTAVVHALRQKTEAAAWDYIVAHPGADSLRFIIGNEQIRLALGIYALDTRVARGDTWQYRVQSLDAKGSVTATVVGAPVRYPASVAFQPVRATRVEEADSTGVVWWRINPGGPGLSARVIEVWGRRGRTGDFKRVDSVLAMTRISDSLFARWEAHGLAPGAMYQYYAVPRDLFFNRGPRSDTVTVYAANILHFALPDSLHAAGVDSLGIVVTWRFAHPELARAIRIYRAPAQDSGYRLVAEVPAATTRWVDPQPPIMEMAYYRLTVTGPRNEESPPTASTFGYFRRGTPPAPPYGLLAKAGPRGRGAALVWQRSHDAGLRGYYVLRSTTMAPTLGDSTPLEVVSPLLGAADTTFLDTVSVVAPGREYAYVVQAVDLGNLRSAYSAPAYFSAAEHLTSPTPTGARGYARPGQVRLFWDDMTQVSIVVGGYRVERRSATVSTAWRPLTATPLGATENSFLDSAVTAGRTYDYRVESVDRDGHASAPSAPVRIVVPRLLPPPPAGVRALAEADGIRLAWGRIEGVTGTIRVYRYTRGTRPVRLAVVPATDTTFVDRTARRGRRYYYFATLEAGGAESARSAEVTARR